MLHCLIKLSDKTKLKHSRVRPAVSVQVHTATTRSSQCGWRPRLSLGRQPIRTLTPALKKLTIRGGGTCTEPDCNNYSNVRVRAKLCSAVGEHVYM